MTTRVTNPALGAESFNCPSCGALAHQDWFHFYSKFYEKDSGQWIPDSKAAERVLSDKDLSPEHRDSFSAYYRKRLSQLPFFDQSGQDTWVRLELENVYASKCYSCDALALWVFDKPIFPPTRFHAEPNADLSDDIKLDFDEATKILDLSPRGAAALLRLCVQKLCTQL